MKTKKTVISVLTAVLIIALIISCSELLDNPIPNLVEEKEQAAPPGKTLVRLNLMNLNARTVGGDTSAITGIGDFEYFQVRIADTTTNTSVTLPVALQGNIAAVTTITSTPVALEAGEEYKFTVTAFDILDTRLALGASILRVSSTTNTVSIVLKEIVDGSGEGTFVIDTDVTGWDTVTFTLTDLSDDTEVETDTLITGTASNHSDDYNSGNYLLTITLVKANCETVMVVEVVKIYEGFITTYDAALPVARSNRHLVQYNYNDATNTGIPSQTVNHGGNITNTTGITHSTLTDVFTGWFTDNGVWDNQITGTTVIIKPLSLYARWDPSSIPVDFTGVTLNWTGLNIPQLSGNASFLQSTSTINITITVDNDTDYTTFEWYLDGTLIPSATTATLAINENLASAANWWQAGTHSITLIVDKALSSIESGTFTITCTP
jgi:hypothetical protein